MRNSQTNVLTLNVFVISLVDGTTKYEGHSGKAIWNTSSLCSEFFLLLKARVHDV